MLKLQFERYIIFMRVLKGKNGSWNLPILALGKWDLRHWDWEKSSI